MMTNLELKRTLSEKQQYLLQGEMELLEKSTAVAYAWLFVAGIAGVHRFYLERPYSAWAQLLVVTISFLVAMMLESVFPMVFSIAWWIVDWFLTAEMVRETNRMIEQGILKKLTRPNN